MKVSSPLLLLPFLQPCASLSAPLPRMERLSMSASSDTAPLPHKFLILGGTGRIGTAVASHLLLRSPGSTVVLAGRDGGRGRDAAAEVLSEHPSLTGGGDASGGASFLRLDFRDGAALGDAIADGVDCLIHTAGPYLGERPGPLAAAIASGRCRAYVDVADPLDYLDEGMGMSANAAESGLSAVLAAGAFPGMSNVLAVDAASRLQEGGEVGIRDIRFNYFTAGLGGSGDVNLYITNLGFGEPMAQFDKGSLRLFRALSGLLLGEVSFYLDEDDLEGGFGNDVARERIGRQTVFSWPFPEAATVPRFLGISGDSSAAMGTAPHVWNSMLGVLVSLVPRPWWRSPRLSKFLADFSRPLVKATDSLLRITSPDNVGETHAMRVDVTGEDGTAVSVVQAHESFRRCVGQSCAEFALDLLDHPSPGVHMPEQRYLDDVARRRIIRRLTTAPGTMTFTGPIRVRQAPPPSDMEKALTEAESAEARL